MKISMIVAMAQNRVIGNNNQLPWHLPADLQHFKKLTMGKPIIMGRKTYESIGRPLPGRTNVIISRKSDYSAKDCLIFHSLPSALAALETQEEIMIIGGAELYKEALPLCHCIYLTEVHANIEGDTRLLEWNEKDWQEHSRHTHHADEKHAYDYSFVSLRRR